MDYKAVAIMECLSSNHHLSTFEEFYLTILLEVPSVNLFESNIDTELDFHSSA